MARTPDRKREKEDKRTIAERQTEKCLDGENYQLRWTAKVIPDPDSKLLRRLFLYAKTHTKATFT